jgi:5-methylcytosine-specific restriction protein B
MNPKEDLLATYRRVEQECSPESLEARRIKFLESFGPDCIRAASGQQLLELFHGQTSTQTRGLIYNIEVEPTLHPFGGVKGGSALKFKVYRGWNDQQFYRKGPGKEPVPASDAEALQITESLARSIVRGLELADELNLAGGSFEDWKSFDEAVKKIDGQWIDKGPTETPILELGWVHKYLSMVRPDLFSFHHQYHALAQHLIRLGQQPEPGRYVVDWQWRNLRQSDPDFAPLYSPILMSAAFETFGQATGYWRVGTMESVTGSKVARWPAMRNGGFASIGWCWIGDLAVLLEGLTGEPAKQRIKENISTMGAPGRSARQIYQFYAEMKPGDRIVAMNGQTILGVGVVASDYEYVQDDVQPHHRRVDWLSEPQSELWPGFPGYLTTVYEFSGKYFDAAKIEALVAQGTGLTGPPLPDPSAGLRCPDWSTASQEGNATEGAVAELPVDIVSGPSMLPLDSEMPLNATESRIREVLVRKGQVILYGPPGTGKTYYARRAAHELVSRQLYGGRAWSVLSETDRQSVDHHITFCTFHPGFGYEDFIEGYRPEIVDGQPFYKRRNGIFLEACEKARRDRTTNHILIIDEVNRGNVATVLGELITLIESDKREKLSVVLPLSGDTFTVPENLWIIGTMNTADRSISVLDAALRRRFGFIELLPEYDGLQTLIGDLSLAALLKGINERIRRTVRRNARELQVGHAFLMKDANAIRTKTELQQVMRDDIIPLLAEYCFENYSVVADILSKDIIDVEAQRPREAVVNDPELLYSALLQLVQEEPTSIPLQDAATEDVADEADDSDQSGDEE